jgi:group I intron endonuclease
MSKGIYQYTDLKTGDVVYVGKDSYIHKNQRHSEHLRPSFYDRQVFNRVLQNNPDRYEYEVVCEADHYSDVYLNCLEKGLIKVLNPKFNYTKGGDGSVGYKHSLESRKKMSEARKGEKNHFYGRHHTEESKQKIRDKVSGEKNCWYGKSRSLNNKINVSKASSSTGIFRVTKIKKTACKQGFMYEYRYYDDDGKRKAIASVDLDKLEEKVLSKGLVWKVMG